MEEGDSIDVKRPMVAGVLIELGMTALLLIVALYRSKFLATVLPVKSN